MYLYSDDLTEIATKFGTDKWNSHWYAMRYHSHFEKFRFRKINLLEIGIGGYDDPSKGGASLRTWEEYFPFGKIVGLDLHEKFLTGVSRITVYQGDQADGDLLRKINDECGGFDIIIDDGSHRCEHIISTFSVLFPLLRRGGLYAVEDTQTSYWKRFGGDSDDLQRSNTTVGFFKMLADGINFREFESAQYSPSYTDNNITGIHFYHNLIIVDKDVNFETSNYAGGIMRK